MAAADLVDFFKSILDILNIIPANQRLGALVLLILLIVLLGVLHFNTLKLIGEKAREKAIFMIIRYGFIGAGVIFFITYGYNLITFKSEAASLNQSITNLGQSTQLSSSGKLNPILPQDQIQKLAESIVLLSRSFDAPPGIADALTQLQAGNIAPAVDILQKHAQSQTDAAKQAEAWRRVGLLAFYKDTQVALQAYQQSVKLDPDHWEAWSQIAYLLERTGDHDGAKAAAQRAIDIGARRNDKRALAAGDAAFGYIAASTGNLSSAGDYLEKARDNLRGPDLLAEYARATSSLARVKYAGADYDAARSLYEEALKSDTAADNPGGMAADYTGLAQLLVELSEPNDAAGLRASDEATDYLNKALAIGRNLNDKHQQAMALSRMADIDEVKNNLDGAEKDCTDALNLENELGYKLPAVYLAGKLADIAHKKHNDPDAEKKYVAAIGMAKDIKNPFAEAVERRGIGTLYSDEKKYLLAISAFNRAVAVDRSLALTNYLAWDLQSLGWVYAAQGQSAEACSSYGEAETLFQKIGYDDYAAQTHEAAAKIPCAK